jgi:hypothetical protein
MRYRRPIASDFSLKRFLRDAKAQWQEAGAINHLQPSMSMMSFENDCSQNSRFAFQFATHRPTWAPSILTGQSG